VANNARPHHVGGSGAATWPEETIYSKVSTVGPDPHGKVSDPWIHRPDPGTGPGPLRGVRATHNRVPGFWEKEYPDLNQGQAGVRSRHVSGPYRIHLCSPLRQRPDAATWRAARDVSQRAEPDVRPLGHALKRPDPLGLKCDTITSPRRLVNTFLTSNSTEFR
jgi:hypothetical protein